MTNRRRALFLGGGLILCVVIITLPRAEVYKNILGLILGAIILLAVYPVKRH
jgi:hypothetical protein